MGQNVKKGAFLAIQGALGRPSISDWTHLTSLYLYQTTYKTWNQFDHEGAVDAAADTTA